MMTAPTPDAMAVADEVWVVMGGVSPERMVSLQSGQDCMHALRQAGYTVRAFDFTGDVYALVAALDQPDRQRIVVFNALHGGFGEDGRFQMLLDRLAIRYTHSGAKASMAGVDKALAKAVMQRAGLPVLPHVMCSAAQVRDRCFHAAHAHDASHSHDASGGSSNGWPFAHWIAKPVNGGSSIGMVAHPPPHLCVPRGNDAADANLAGTPYARAVSALGMEGMEGMEGMAGAVGGYMVEPFIVGRELTVGVLDGKAMAVTEIVHRHAYYTYASKYGAPQAHCCPADLPEAAAVHVQEIAEKAYDALRCRGVARVDMMVPADAPDKPVVLEINTCPGMTAISLVPEQAQLLGMSFAVLLQRMLATARYDGA